MQVIIPGYLSVVSFEFPDRYFPGSATFSAQVREKPTATSPILNEMSTALLNITLTGSNVINLIFTDIATKNWAMASVVVDIVRTDVTYDEHLGFLAVVPVFQPSTRLVT